MILKKSLTKKFKKNIPVVKAPSQVWRNFGLLRGLDKGLYESIKSLRVGFT